MAANPIYVLIICLQMYEHVSGQYCQNEDKASIPFCQNGTISGLKVYINGSSVKTTIDLKDRGCVCYLEQNKNMEIIVDAKESCLFCGLKVGVGNSYLTSNYYGSERHGWGSIVLTDTKFTMTLGVDGTPDSLNTAFCIAIQENSLSVAFNSDNLYNDTKNNLQFYDTDRPDNPVVLTLTCEELVMMNKTSSTGSSSSPNLITTTPNILPNTTKSQSPTSAATDTQLTKTETARTAEVSNGDTNLTQDPKATNTSTAATTTTTTTTTTNSPGELRSPPQSDVIIPAAAGGGAGVLVILVIIIVVCCLRKKRQNALKPIYMNEVDKSDVLIMTDNPTYDKAVDTQTNSVPHIGPQCTGDVYAVVNKEGNSNVPPSAEVPHMQVGETGDIYAIVNKEKAQEIPNREHSDGKSAEFLVQTRNIQDNVSFGTATSTDYPDIAIDNTDADGPVIKFAVNVDYAEMSNRGDN